MKAEKRAFFDVCPDCGASLDHGEKCDCARPQKTQEQKAGRAVHHHTVCGLTGFASLAPFDMLFGNNRTFYVRVDVACAGCGEVAWHDVALSLRKDHPPLSWLCEKCTNELGMVMTYADRTKEQGRMYADEPPLDSIPKEPEK